jgi:N-acetylglutamate synthase-like GNAT family acetyltransferase
MPTFEVRNALPSDVSQISELISASVRGLAKGIYDDRQIERSIASVFGVDHQLINDGTYFVAESDGQIVGCGGWSKRKTLYGASVYEQSRDSEELDPETDACKIRSFFVHPGSARQGIGRAILERCEADAKAAGFSSAEMMSTLPGVPLYETCGYIRHESVGVPIGEGDEIECIRMSRVL